MESLNNKRPNLFKRIFLHSPFRYLIAFIICVGVSLLYIGIRNTWLDKFEWGNALFIAGIAMAFFGLLVIVLSLGGFDIFGYGFSALRGQNRKHKDLYEYSEAKKESRQGTEFHFVPYLLIGIIFLLVGVLLNSI